jgi:hypothetical protein
MHKLCRKAKVIHVILDNYRIHDSKITQAALRSYCPMHNRIEGVLEDLHATPGTTTVRTACPTAMQTHPGLTRNNLPVICTSAPLWFPVSGEYHPQGSHSCDRVQGKVVVGLLRNRCLSRPPYSIGSWPVSAGASHWLVCHKLETQWQRRGRVRFSVKKRIRTRDRRHLHRRCSYPLFGCPNRIRTYQHRG